jgi:sugar/nucleoside kinase (ribokinase family)
MCRRGRPFCRALGAILAGMLYDGPYVGHARSPALMTQGGNVGILVVGSVALDSVYTPFGQAENVLGGAASYFVAAAALYDRVSLVGVVGQDFPEPCMDFLRSRNADLSGFQVVPGRTFRWGGRYALDMNARETLYTELGVFEDFHPNVPPALRRSEVVFLANIQPRLQLEVLKQTSSGVGGDGRASGAQLHVLDTMDLWIETAREALTEVMRQVDIVLIAEEEARQYAGVPGLRAAARQILGLGPKLLVIKQGSYGALLLGADGSYFAAPAYPLEDVCDPTGAGDAFAGGFLGHLAARLKTGWALTHADYRRALVHGNIMGAYACEDFSVNRLRALTPADIATRYQEFVRFTHFEGSWRDGEG